MNTDFLVASAYKWFGPTTGCLYGKGELLETLEPYKLRPAPASGPAKWETGTQSLACQAGVRAAVDYIASLGGGTSRRTRIESAWEHIVAYEQGLSERFLAGIAPLLADGSLTLFGKDGVEGRTPTFALSFRDREPREVAKLLGDQGIFVWSGNYYAVEIMARLGFPDGLVRIGFCHYNTAEEVDRTLAAISGICTSS